MKKRLFPAFSAIILVFGLICGTANAVEDRASTTLSSYNIGLKVGENSGEIIVTYDVCANIPADCVGLSSLTIYKSNGVPVTTITGSTANGLLRNDSVRHRSTYTYTGTSGTSYYASVTVYAKIGSDTDSRRVTTDIVKAP